MQFQRLSRFNPQLALALTLSGTAVGALAARSYLGPIIPAITFRNTTRIFAVKQAKGELISAEDISNLNTLETIL
jgi:ABC-type enterochelin transport system substrate-binding protein